MLRNILALLFSLSLLVSVQAQYYAISLDTQSPSEQFVIDRAFSGNNTWLRAWIYESGVAADLSGWALTFRYSYGQYSTQGMVTVNGSISSNRVDFLGATNVYAAPFDKYYWSISGQHSDGYTKTFGTGTLKVYFDPATDTNLYALMEQVNISWLTNSVGAQVESNRVNIGIMQTGKTDVVTFNATNALKVDITTFNATNALKVDVVTFNATNALKTDIATFNATNALKVDTTTFNATNVLKVDITTFNATNVLKADKTTVNATSTVFEARIASNETFRITTQPATNLVIQNQVTANYTNQNATNTLLQDQIDVVGTGTWSLALLSDGSRPANYLDVVNTNYLGANIVTNGTFTGSASNWSLTTFFYSGNRVVLNPSLTGSIEYTNTLVVTSKKLYQLTVGTTYAGAAVTASVGGVTSTWTSVDGATQTEYFFADNDSKIVISAGTGTNSLELDNITLKECPTGSIFVAQDVNTGNSVKARVGVYAPNITAISNNADIIKGGTFSGPITNLYGYYGDGGGLTNITATTTNVPVHDQDWSTITGTPTSLSGYGITNSTGDSMTRYFANTNAGQVVEVYATGTGITASRTNEKFYVSIPSGVRVTSMRMRVDGDYTASGVIYLQMGTNDMDNSGFATMWVPSVNCIRESDYANVVLTCKPDSVDDTLIKIAGLGTTAGIVYALHLVF